MGSRRTSEESQNKNMDNEIFLIKLYNKCDKKKVFDLNTYSLLWENYLYLENYVHF